MKNRTSLFYFLTLILCLGATAMSYGQTVAEEPAAAMPTPDGMVLIPAGEFQMGSNHSTDAEKPVHTVYVDAFYTDAEKPVHTVYVDAFYMDVYEVTMGQYRKFLQATGQGAFPDWMSKYSPTDMHPVSGVGWRDAMAYAIWAGKRLPTEAEWEYAARGGLVGKTYPWGNAIDASKANYADNIGSPTPVGSYGANGYGLYDMAGNVWEWCLDELDADFYARSPRQNPLAGDMSLREVIANYRSVESEPVWNGSRWVLGSWRVLRGGSWDSTAWHLRVANRRRDRPMFTVWGIGFRCVQDVTP